MPAYRETPDGLMLEGQMTVTSDEHVALIQIGDEFLDECLWRRFQPAAGDLRLMSPRLRLDRVRIVVERIAADAESKPEETPLLETTEAQP